MKRDDGAGTHCDSERAVHGSSTEVEACRRRSREQTLEYVSELVVELRELAMQAGSERLATLLALAQYEVRGLIGKCQSERKRRP